MSSANEDTAKSSTEQLPSAANSTTQKEERVMETREEVVREVDKVPGNPNYYEKEGLRTYGDGQDHDQEPPMSFRRFMSFVGMAFLWTSAQIPAYLWGGIPPIVYQDIGGADRWIWFITGNLLATAGVCPFVGALSDLMGRRYVALIGSLFIIVGQIVCSTAREMNVFIGGMVISGIGAGANELTALAGTAELAPTSRRGIYVAVLIFTIIPFCPSVMWAQLIAAYSTWRYVGLLICLWTALGFLVVLFFYFPPPRVNSLGLSRREVLQRIDFAGGLLSVSGIILFDMGLLWGGYQHPWGSAHVLVPLFLGVALLAAFVLWEIYGAPHPMFPRRLGRAPRTLALTLVLTFISGANFFSVLMLWPSQAYNVYGHDPVGVGLRGLPFGLGVLAGCVATLYLLTALRGANRTLLLAASCVMTAGCGALAAARRDNLPAVFAVLLVAGLGVGGIVVPASLVATIICPDDVIATVTALTLAVRVVGGAVGYAVYYNVFVRRAAEGLVAGIGAAMVRAGVDPGSEIIGQAIALTGAAEIDAIRSLPGMTDELWEVVVVAGQVAYEGAYPYVYYASMAFGVVAIVASWFVEDISQFMDDHVAVIIH